MPEKEKETTAVVTTLSAEDLGHQFAKGACSYLMGAIGILVLMAILWNAIRNYMNISLDDSDADGWNRSGLKVHTDHKTGIEYLSDGNGGLTPRLPKPLNLTSPEK